MSYTKFMLISTRERNRNWIKKITRNLNEANDLVMVEEKIQGNKQALKMKKTMKYSM